MERTGRPRSELESLVVELEEAEIDRRLREVLDGRVGFERGSGRVVVRPGLLKLPQRQRILTLLMARHALKRLSLGTGDLDVDPAVLATEAQVSLKAVREYVSKLKAKGILQKGPNGYSVPPWNILIVANELGASPEG